MQYTDDKLREFCNKRGLTFVKRIEGSKIEFVCNKHPQKGIQVMWVTNLIRGKTCGCSHRNYTKEDFINNKNFPDNIEVLGEYVNDSTPILVKCTKCGREWKVEPNKLLHGRKCANCNKEARLEIKRKEFHNHIENQWKDITLTSKYMGAKSPISYICHKCGKEYTVSHAGNLWKRRPPCPTCNKSIHENEIAEWLDLYGIEYIRECIFHKCRHIDNLKYDFYLPEYNMVVEYQGEQHFFPVNFKGGDYDATVDFELNQIRDEIKRKYCKAHSIRMIEIPYFDQDKINEILSELLL